MKTLRITLACTLLMAAALAPTALACGTCSDVYIDSCERTPGSGTRCRYTVDACTTISAPFCTLATDTDAPPTMLANWTVLSVEITRPDGTKDVTAPVAVASADTAAPAARK